MRIVVVNVGSASAKAAAFEVTPGAETEVARWSREIPARSSHAEAVESILAQIGTDPVDAVGHRVVHGGTHFTAPTLIDDGVEAVIDDLSRLAPQHNPPALAAIRATRTRLPGTPMVAVFDTAFHASRAPESMRYALPWQRADEVGLVRFGFHGVAHASLLDALAAARGRRPETLHAVTLQLGAGCSACAIERGRSVETSMGFSPLEGLAMATRSGDVDPIVVFELMRRGEAPDAVERLLTRESGLLGLSGHADMRALLAAEEAGDERARVAVALFVRRIVMSTGAYLTLLGGEGALVFGGGIGARSPEIRRRVASGLSAWNVRLDEALNAAGEPGLLSPPDARPVYAFETDEERRIARCVFELLGASASG